MRQVRLDSLVEVDDETFERIIHESALQMTERFMQMWHPIVDSDGYIDLPDDADWYLVTAENDVGERRQMVTWFTPANTAMASPAVWGNYSKAGRWKNLAWMFLPPIWEEDNDEN